MADLLRAFELCAKAVRSVVGGLVDCDVRRPHVGADALADKEAEEEAGEPVTFYTESYGDKAVRILVDRDVDGSWWSAEAVKARARVETPLSATFNDELEDVALSRQRFLDEQHGPDRICIFCFGKRSECTHSYQEMFVPKTSDAAGATVASVEDPSPDVPPASGEADSVVGPCPDCGLDTAFYPDQCIICGDKPDWKALFAHPGRIMAIPEPDGVVIPSTVTRVVLVHGNYPERTVTEKWAQEWDLHIQDDGRTLKLFSKNPTGPRYEDTPGFFGLPGGSL